MLDMDEKLMTRSVNEGFSGRPSSLGKEERNVFARQRIARYSLGIPRGTCFEMCVTGREALTQAIRLRRERFVYAKLSVVSHSGFFIIWRRIESSNYDFYFWAWVECASVSARRKASKSAQMRVVVLPSRVLTTGSSLFDE